MSREPVEARIEGMAHEGRGITHDDQGRPVFVDFALPGERIRYRYTKLRRQRAEATAIEILEPAAERIAPGCEHFGNCGGCALQHLPAEAQIAHKERVLAEQLQRIGGVEPEQWLAPLTGPAWGYRRKARLAVKHVPKKGGVLVGFREKHSPLVAPVEYCPVLDPRVGERMQGLAELVGSLSIPDRIPQIEVACGDKHAALVFRHLAPLTEDDLDRLSDFAEATGLTILRQPGDESTVTPVAPQPAPQLSYALSPYGVEVAFLPTDFTQVNASINMAMVERALEWLQPQSGRRILDLFCGVGNFTLPLAREGATVTGIEGDPRLVERAEENAAANGLHADFAVADLATEEGTRRVAGGFDAVLLDPPRSGAQEVLSAVAGTGARRVVYCSCGPATLARDAGILVAEHGFRLNAAGIMDMFPHTAHVESFAVFDRD
ncbi:23S rRNA (uracil(1939)-C(5))-methyltransferase RlmD [Halorhodospira halophila]|uniref:23S rRNA (uracil(1939)-C(5))-methyltransferase RlmD n=1 Tax=Halorhodospira halophila (strain DSM 244 / SL1) TaxID=349124 RepID=A1WT11_HALHL|nr:23S rRNA (uracil(1939)-C(5))-methyltransferase RlmD [Halorhodospira halophila]ABM60823.1 23S rRNA m(5)U-1939 methyltransferase [Halorhodospira halophila SL1]MBK1728478.1 23S rRNA (uracil(1939)-C(5))-methyltransferase RlmD [Halorhodospira halophila]